MANDQLKAERVAFEKWWDESNDIPNDGPWERDSPIQFAWAAWLAARVKPEPVVDGEVAEAVQSLHIYAVHDDSTQGEKDLHAIADLLERTEAARLTLAKFGQMHADEATLLRQKLAAERERSGRLAEAIQFALDSPIISSHNVCLHIMNALHAYQSNQENGK